MDKELLNRQKRSSTAPRSPATTKLQRKAAGASNATIAPPIVHEVLNSPGRPLEQQTRSFLEPQFGHGIGGTGQSNQTGPAATHLKIASPGGELEQQADRISDQAVGPPGSAQPSAFAPVQHDFGSVRIHTDAKAAASAEAVEALAYTTGRDIVFAAGQYQPETTEGRRLLAHELAHVVQQDGTTPGAGVIQRKLAVDPAKFSGQNAAKDKADFEKMIVDDLNVVTGMNLSFSSDVLTASGKPAGGSATAQKILNMALNDPNTVYVDPRTTVGAQHNRGRGIEISTAKLPLQIKALRPGIQILHELTHQYASALKPANYDQNMQQLEQKAAGGGAITPDESELLAFHNARDPQSDENIARLAENQIQQELGLIKRIHYGFPMEFPKGTVKTYAEFQAGSTFIYLEVGSYDIYSSSVDYFAQGGGKGPPVANPADFKKIVKGSPEYRAIQQHLL